MASVYATETTGSAVVEGGPVAPRRVSWGAILAGAVIALAISTMLHLLGAGIAAGTVNAAAGRTPDVSSFTTGAALWLAFSTIVGLGIGGFVAGRLSGTTDTEDGLMHGLAVWAVAAVLSMVVVGSAVVSVAGATARGVGDAAGSAATAAAPAVADAARNSDQRALIDGLTRSLSVSSDPASMTDNQRGNAVVGLIEQRVRNGRWTPEQRARAVDLVERGAGVPQGEANRRVTAIEQNLAQAEQQAREAADAAARAASRAALWSFASLLIGAIVAAAASAGGVRNAVWLINARRRVIAG
jgi:hypothetical protein